MSFSDRILGKKSPNGKPHIETVTPAAALPGGDVRIIGAGLKPAGAVRPRVHFGDSEGTVVIGAEEFIVVRVPYGAGSGVVTVDANGSKSNCSDVTVAHMVAENMHPVTNPAIDAQGNVFTTFSGSRGDKVPVSIYKIDTEHDIKPFLAEIM